MKGKINNFIITMGYFGGDYYYNYNRVNDFTKINVLFKCKDFV